MTNSYVHQQQLAQDRFGLRVTARLSDAADELPHDISERLRASRVQALGKRKIVTAHVTASAATSAGRGILTFGSGHHRWWDRVFAVVPLLALALGLVAINIIQDDNRTNEVAEIDAALLTDDLPPAAYTDPGFGQFLRMSSDKIHD